MISWNVDFEFGDVIYIPAINILGIYHDAHGRDAFFEFDFVKEDEMSMNDHTIRMGYINLSKIVLISKGDFA